MATDVSELKVSTDNGTGSAVGGLMTRAVVIIGIVAGFLISGRKKRSGLEI
jgi:hypothetical protein